MFKAHESMVVAGADPRVLNAMSLGLLLNFQRYDAAFDPRITYTGASARMYFDSTGTLKYAPSNRVTNNTMVGAVAGSPGTLPTTWAQSGVIGGLTRTLAVGSENGIPYLDIRWAGTPSGTGLQSLTFNSNITILVGETWSMSLDVQLVGGDLTNVNNMLLRLSGESGSTAVVPTATMTRYTNTRTATSTTASCVLRWNYADTITPIDFTLRIRLPQLNPGSEVHDPIQTSGTAVYLPRSNAYQDHDPVTMAPLGFLIEEARTNSIRNNTMVGAVAGSTGTIPTNWQSASSATGISRNSVAVGTENGIPYVDLRYTGTASSSGTVQITPEQVTGVAALTAQVWTASYYLKHVGGTLPGNVSTVWVERDAGGASVTTGNTSAITVTSADLATQRAAVTRTLSGGGTVAFVTNRIEINVTNGATVDFTLRIGLPQLELGAFATSPILTFGSAATRLADSASMTGTNFSSWYNQTEGTFVVRGDPISQSVNQCWISANDGTANERVRIVNTSAAQIRLSVIDGGVEDGVVNKAITLTSPAGLGAAYAANDLAFSINGDAPGTDTTASLPTVNALSIGSDRGLIILNGHLQSLTYYRNRLPNATIQSLTS